MAVAHTQVNATHPRERRPRGKNAGDKRAAASDETTGPIALVSLPRLGVCVCGGGGRTLSLEASPGSAPNQDPAICGHPYLLDPLRYLALLPDAGAQIELCRGRGVGTNAATPPRNRVIRNLELYIE